MPKSKKPSLSPQAERAFLAKIAKADYYELRDELDDVVARGPDRDAFLWDLALRGKLPLGNPHVADRFSGAAPSIDAVLQVWTTIGEKSATTGKQQWKGAPTWVSAVIYDPIDKDPSPWRARADELPEPLRSIVWLELANCKKDKVPSALRDSITKRIVAAAFEENVQHVVENLQYLGHSNEQITRLLLPRVVKKKVRDFELGRLAEIAPPADLVRLLLADDDRSSSTMTVRQILEKRSDSVGDLVAMGSALAKADKSDKMQYWVQAFGDAALARCAASKTKPPEEIDALLTLRFDSEHGPSPHFKVMPPARLLARVKRGMAGDDHAFCEALPALRYCFDKKTYEEALGRVERFEISVGRQLWAVGSIGKDAIPILDRALVEWARPYAGDDELGAKYLVRPTFDPVGGRITRARKALLIAHVEVAKETGRAPDAELFMPFPEANHMMTCPEFLHDEWVDGMAMLPVAKRRKIEAAWRAMKTIKWIRTEVIDPAFGQIESHLKHQAEMRERASRRAS
jgi:hypothetical protein